MNHCGRLLIASVLVIFPAAKVRAGVLLSGNIAGFFQPVSNPHITITNSANGLDASFRSGVPVGNSFKSGVEFNGRDFEKVGNGDTFSSGLFTYYNGISRIGTSSGTALLDLYLNLNDPSVGPVHLTTITFGIDATVNTAGHLRPDTFTASFQQPAPIWVGDELVKFTINGLPASIMVAENAWTDVASISVTVIPETSTYAVMLGVASLAFTLFSRRRIFNPSAHS